MVKNVMELEFQKAYLNYLLNDNAVLSDDIIIYDNDYTLYTGDDYTPTSDFGLRINPAVSSPGDLKLNSDLLTTINFVQFSPGPEIGNISLVSTSNFVSIDDGITLEVETSADYNDINKKNDF